MRFFPPSHENEGLLPIKDMIPFNMLKNFSYFLFYKDKYKEKIWKAKLVHSWKEGRKEGREEGRKEGREDALRWRMH